MAKHNTWKPSQDECNLIMQAAAKEAGLAVGGIRLEPGRRYNLVDLDRAESINIARVATDWEDTDLADFETWAFFRKGVQLTDDGRAVVDFYIRPRNDLVLRNTGDSLLGNVVVEYKDGRMVAVRGGTSNGHNYLPEEPAPITTQEEPAAAANAPDQSPLVQATTAGALAWRALGAKFSVDDEVLQDAHGRVLWRSGGHVVGWQLNPHTGRPIALAGSMNAELAPNAVLVLVHEVALLKGAPLHLVVHAEETGGFSRVPLVELCEKRAQDSEEAGRELAALLHDLQRKRQQ